MGDAKDAASVEARVMRTTSELLRSSRDAAASDVWGWRGDLPSTGEAAAPQPTQDRAVLEARLESLDSRVITGPLDRAISQLAGDSPQPPAIFFLTDRQAATWRPWLGAPSAKSLPERIHFRAAALLSNQPAIPWISLVAATAVPWGAGDGRGDLSFAYTSPTVI